MTHDRRTRTAPLEMSDAEFRSLGHELVDRIADFLSSIREYSVTHTESVTQVREAMDADRALPEAGQDPRALLRNAADLLLEHSLLNGHPRFYGYITSSPAPVGMLAELLAATVNANTGAWKLSPMASEIEAQVIRWIAEFIGYPVQCGGLLVSGGNMANVTCFLAARAQKAGWDIRKEGVAAGPRLCVYASRETHTWIQKAADMTGLGTEAVHWIDDPVNLAQLEARYEQDLAEGYFPFLVVGSAGSVSTGAVDPLPELAEFCKERGLWFHVDGAYGAFGAALPEASEQLKGLKLADSVAVDPHKWLYAPLEAGCALVRDPAALRNAFSYHPSYYNFDGEAVNYYDLGPQNSRGFRALKVWLALQHAGAEGYRQMIRDDMALAEYFYRLAESHPDVEALTHHLSITTFRYVPRDLRDRLGNKSTEDYLNDLNERLLLEIERSGQTFVSNAIVDGRFALRICIVNFRTSAVDVEASLQLIADLGSEIHSALKDQQSGGRNST